MNLNYVYAADLGFGGYSLAGVQADVYTLPLSYTFQNLPYSGWGLKLSLPVQGGIYNFHATDIDGRRISINQQSLALLPGAELEIPVGGLFTLKPFAEFGVVRTFGDSVGNPNSWVYLAGARAIRQWSVGLYTLSLGSSAFYAGDSTMGSGFGEHYVSLQVGGEVRRPLDFTIGGFQPDLGVYVAGYHYPQPLSFSRFLRPPLRVDNQGEIGFSVGSAKPLDLLWFSNPRIGVGFVFGGGLNVWHVNFGFPF